jgi:thiol:disulfide interchange protein DsbD
MLKLIFSLLLISISAFATEDHATISLQRYDNKLVVTIQHDEGWHTYWKNPGDAGLPSIFKFYSANNPLQLKSFEWPTPAKHTEAGDILTIGYEGKQHYFFEDQKGDISAQIQVLICKDICIPGEAKLELKENEQFISNRAAKPFSSSELNDAFNNLPQDGILPANFEYYLTRTKDQNLLTLHYSLKGLKNFTLPKALNLLTAFPKVPFGFKRESLFVDKDTLYGKMEIEWDGEYQEPQIPLPSSGSFPDAYELSFLLNTPGKEQVQKVILNIKDFSISSSSLDSFYKNLTPFSLIKASTNVEEVNVLHYLLLAFLGGLILNLMPCVLPVISLKLFGLIKHQNYSRKELLRHNLSYTLGVIATFMALASVIVGLKSTGEEVGWGFQLQSPAFVLVMMLILFILSLNLFGLFEFVTPGGAKFGNAQLKEGIAGDFFSGVLTTILSTPCSAPFLGTALTFAFTTSSLTIFLIFFFVGIGLAFPFLLTAIFPKGLDLLPRPGAWMEKLKYFLGLSLLATVVWLYDVFVSLVNFDVISWKLNLLFAFWFFAFFFVKKISRHIFLSFFMFMIPVTLTFFAIVNLELKTESASTTVKESVWTPWSESKLSELKGNLVFMDFTAEWCLTCKVNKKLVLETKKFEELAKKHKMTLLRADWTRRDDNITQYLKRYGAVGVPAYFIQKQNGEVIFLGETIGIKEISEHLN